MEKMRKATVIHGKGHLLFDRKKERTQWKIYEN